MNSCAASAGARYIHAVVPGERMPRKCESKVLERGAWRAYRRRPKNAEAPLSLQPTGLLRTDSRKPHPPKISRRLLCRRTLGIGRTHAAMFTKGKFVSPPIPLD